MYSGSFGVHKKAFTVLTMLQSARSGSSQTATRRLASRAQKRVATLSGLRGHGTVAVLPRVVAGHLNRPFARSVTSFGHVSAHGTNGGSTCLHSTKAGSTA